VTQARGFDFHQNLTGAGAFKVNFHNFKRFAGFNGNGGTGAHEDPPRLVGAKVSQTRKLFKR
jgi:hypothetical protein